MSVQNIVLQQLKETHPQAKLKDISQKTGIQITRVFRILNGAEMKVSEWEKFQKLTKSHNGIDEFLNTAKTYALKISPQRRHLLHVSMQQALKLAQLTTNVSVSTQEVCCGL